MCFSSSALHAIYFLVVCPDSAPADVQLFSKGDEVTLRCNHNHGDKMWVLWFRKKDQVEGPVYVPYPLDSTDALMQDKGFGGRVKMSFPDKSLIISNVSLEDRGEYWCAAVNMTSKLLCESATKTLLVHRDPFGIYSTFYLVWSLVLSGALLVLCAAVVTVILKTRRGQQLSIIWTKLGERQRDREKDRWRVGDSRRQS
uniref:Ig-like domain-containing protein n=1 Tax=Myripristis murdjan TaxID=586833 RepID=A0A667Y1D5_9TELE